MRLGLTMIYKIKLRLKIASVNIITSKYIKVNSNEPESTKQVTSEILC